MTGNWAARRQALEPCAGERVEILAAGRSLTFAEVIEAWRDNEAFRSWFIAALAAAPHAGFFWEMPPIRRGALDIAYEYVTIGSATFDRLRPDVTPFRSELGAAEVASFANLGGDAMLIVPRAVAGIEAYGHIASFMRSAPAAQQHELLEILAREITAAIERSAAPLWVSTSGLGVAWVHVRLDSWPKYYSHEPYRRTA
jgi:hypothetical protein